MSKRVSLLALALCSVVSPLPAGAQQAQPAQPAKSAKTTKAPAKKTAAEPDPMAEIRRTTAVSLVTTLADDARAFREPGLRARVQARSADALWDTDRERAAALARTLKAEAPRSVAMLAVARTVLIKKTERATAAAAAN